MRTHQPDGYDCPFCRLQRGVHNEHNQPADVALPRDVGHAVWDLTQQVAVAMRDSYGCYGISTRQHNEPAGDQDVWHLHVHVFPRWSGDRLYEQHRATRWAAPDERAPHAERLAAALGTSRTFA